MHHLRLIHAIGGTPMVELRNCSPKRNVRPFDKLEGWNPTADSGRQYQGTHLSTSPAESDEGEELDGTIWW